MRTWLFLFALSLSAQTPISFSNVSITANSSSSVRAAWQTNVAADSQVRCGTSSAASDIFFPPQRQDTGVAPDGPGATTHAVVVPGFSAGATVYCRLISSGVTSPDSFAVTLPSETASTPITVNAGRQPGRYPELHPGTHLEGDTYQPALALDGTVLSTLNDGMVNGVLSNLQVLVKSADGKWNLANGMTGFGGSAAQNTNGYTEVPSRSWKSGGPAFYGNRFVLPVERMMSRSPWYQGCSSLIYSTDSTASQWVSPQNPVPAANGNPPTNGFCMWPGDGPMARPSLAFVCAGNQNCPSPISNADAYQYLISFSTQASTVGTYLARVPYADLLKGDATKFTYYQGGDGLLNTAWTTDVSQAALLPGLPVTTMYTGNLMYLPRYRRWLLVGAGSYQGYFYDAPHPWGPWTLAGGIPQVDNFKLGFFAFDPSTSADNGDGTWRMEVNASGDYSGGYPLYSLYSLPVFIAPRPSEYRPVGRYVSMLDQRQGFPAKNLALLYLGNETPGSDKLRDYSGNGNDSPFGPRVPVAINTGQGLRQRIQDTDPYVGITSFQLPLGDFTMIVTARVEGPVASNYEKLVALWDGRSQYPDVLVQRAGNAATCQFQVYATPASAGTIDLCTNQWRAFVIRRRSSGGTTTVDALDLNGNVLGSAAGPTPASWPTLRLYWGSGISEAPDQLINATLGILALYTNGLTGDSLQQASGAAAAAMRERGVDLGYTGVPNPIVPPTFNGPLDAVSGLENVYSLRRLLASYNGPALKVRTSAAGNAMQTIPYTPAGDLDTAALIAFCGSNTCTVDTLYEQRSGRHATQADPARQPVIVENGTLLTAGGKPTLKMNNSLLLAPTNITGSDAIYAQVGAVAPGGSLYAPSGVLLPTNYSPTRNCWGTETAAWFLGRRETSDSVMMFRATVGSNDLPITPGVLFWSVSQFTSSQYSFAVNNFSPVVSAPSTSAAFNSTTFAFGTCDGETTTNWGMTSEAILFSAVPTTAVLTAIHSNQRAYYGLP